MNEGHRMREPQKVAAAVEIAQTVRGALADSVEPHGQTGWDSGVLMYELARTLATLMRFSEASPSQLEELVEFLRKVCAGLSPSTPPTVEEVLRHLCSESVARTGSEKTSPDDVVVQQHDKRLFSLSST